MPTFSNSIFGRKAGTIMKPKVEVYDSQSVSFGYHTDWLCTKSNEKDPKPSFLALSSLGKQTVSQDPPK